MENNVTIYSIKLLLLTITIIALILGITGILWLGESSLPPLYYSGAAPTNPTIEGSLWLSSMFSQNNYTTIYVSKWGNSVIKMLEAYNKSCLILFIISPEKPYNCSEARNFLKLINSYNRVRLIIASETIYANSLLACLKTPIAISSKPILNNNSVNVYLVPAVFRINNHVYKLLLNLASRLKILENYSSDWLINIIGVSTSPKAIVGVKADSIKGNRNLSIIVIGDGFPFTNLAKLVEARIGKKVYSAFALSLIECKPENTIIAFDLSKYYNIHELLLSPALSSRYTRSIDRLAAYIASSMHPSIWVPSINRYIHDTDKQLFVALKEQTIEVTSAMLLTTFIIIYTIFKKTGLVLSPLVAARKGVNPKLAMRRLLRELKRYK